MKKYILVICTLTCNLTFCQVFINKTETEKLLDYFLRQDTVSKIVYDYPTNITTYQFEGNYSREKVFPNTPDNVLICAVPITYETSIHKVLKNIDLSYDSNYYQTQIKNSSETPWSKQNLSTQIKMKLIKSKFSAYFYHQINIFSTPLFSKDGKIAIISLGTVDRQFVIKKREKIFIFKKNNMNWNLIQTINSIKNW